MSVDTINRLFAVFIVSMGVFLASIIVVAVFGLYQWDYRCREGVTEERFELFKSVPVGGWAALDGDPAGGC